MAKHSNPDPQTSNFYLLNTSHSQFLGTGDSLSLPSEPPDIRNWFSSYVYESPELNTCNDLECYGFRKSGCVVEGFHVEEKEENLGEFRKIRNNEETVIGEKVASNGVLKSQNTDEDHNYGNKNASQVLGSLDSISLPSEPPDIKRWFSSYVYESSVLDPSDDFIDSVATETESERVGSDFGNCNKEKGEDLTVLRRTGRDTLAPADEKISSNGLDIHAVEKNKIPPVLNETPVKVISEQVVEGKQIQKCEYASTPNDQKSSLDGQVSIGKEKRTTEADIMSSNANGDIDPNNRKPRTRDSIERRKPICGSNEKENDGKIFQENGFVSTRIDRSVIPNGDGSLKRSVEVQFGCLRSRVIDSSVVGNESNLRKPLSETTNFQNIDASEITGKWRCPQKRKPNLGPPLKQLRLEQWVHRL